MTAAPGWYPDPSGIPNAFRWWDGGSWTTSISASAHAPVPLNAQPAGGPAADTAHSAGVGASSSHPGPDFEPAPWTRIETEPQAYAPIPAVAPTGMKPWKIAVLFASVLAVVLVAGGIYLAMRKSSEPAPPVVTPQPTQPQSTPSPLPTPSPTVSPQPTQPTENPTPSPQPTQSQQPPQSPQPSQSPQPTQTPQVNVAHLVYTVPAASWRARTPLLTSTQGGPIPQYQGYYQSTQDNYTPGHNWVAMMVSLTPRPEWGVEKNQKTGLANLSNWYQASSFDGAALTPTTIVNKKVTVDGKSGWLLQQHYAYDIPGLISKGETGTFVSVQTGKNTAAVYLASIPDTNKDLKADVDAAIKSLKIEQ